LQPVEVVARPIPPRQLTAIDAVEKSVLDEEGIDVNVFQTWLRTNNLALVVSRNVTTRDRADREQPFNLRVAGTTNQTLGTNAGKIYDIRYLQFMQADQLRGLTFGTTNPVPGRRVVATTLHDSISVNIPNPTGPTGSTRLGDDGSQATFVPARRAMSWQLTDTNGNHVVRERYWVTFQPGEIRTCASCHGINTADQAGRPKPTNKPQALRELVRYWKTQTGYSKILSAARTNNSFRINVSAAPNRTNLLEMSSDLNAWSPLLTNRGGTSGLFSFDDNPGTNSPRRFYRLSVP
jgi:hypothetical protein